MQRALNFQQALSQLHPDDRGLPQILRIRELLGRGLAVHHAGVFLFG